MGVDTGPATAGPVSLFAEEQGAGDPVVLLQGLGYAGWAWRKQIPLLARRRRAIALDNRGTGRSPKPPGPYSIELLADDAAAAIRSREASPSHVVGFSMGGYVALTLALRHPGLVRSLVLVGTGAGGTGSVPVPQSTLDVWLANAALPPEEYARATMWLSYSDAWVEAHADELEELIAARLQFPTPPECWRAQYEACEAYAERGVRVEEIRVPALVVHGTADRIVPVENGRVLAARLRDARLVELPGRGHVVAIEDPEAFDAALLEFLDSVSAEASR